MSEEREGNGKQENQVNYLQSRIQETDEAHSSRTLATPTLERPHNLRSGAGEKSSFTRNLNNQEKKVGEQTCAIFGGFIIKSVKQDNLDLTQKNQIQNAIRPEVQQETPQPSITDEEIKYIGETFRKIGDQTNQDPKFKSLINKISALSTKATFIKICEQVFSDGVFNWGRVVTLFYLAYLLISKVAVAVDSISLIKEIFSWAIDFFLDNVLWWVIERGGWKMIREYWGTPSKTIAGLLVLATLCTCYVLWKQQ